IYLFFQAEDGIRDRNVTGVQTCALPISKRGEREVSKEITESTITGPDGTEIKSLFELNEDVAEELEDAEESDATLEEVLQDKDDVTSYYAETYMMINAFDGSSDKAAANDLVGLKAEI